MNSATLNAQNFKLIIKLIIKKWEEYRKYQQEREG